MQTRFRYLIDGQRTDRRKDTRKMTLYIYICKTEFLCVSSLFLMHSHFFSASQPNLACGILTPKGWSRDWGAQWGPVVWWEVREWAKPLVFLYISTHPNKRGNFFMIQCILGENVRRRCVASSTEQSSLQNSLQLSTDLGQWQRQFRNWSQVKSAFGTACDTTSKRPFLHRDHGTGLVYCSVPVCSPAMARVIESANKGWQYWVNRGIVTCWNGSRLHETKA